MVDGGRWQVDGWVDACQYDPTPLTLKPVNKRADAKCCHLCAGRTAAASGAATAVRWEKYRKRPKRLLAKERVPYDRYRSSESAATDCIFTMNDVGRSERFNDIFKDDMLYG